MELYLIRHGQSANSLREQVLAEHPRTTPPAVAPRMVDPPLTALGELQARLAGESLRDEGLTKLLPRADAENPADGTDRRRRARSLPHVFVGLHEWGGVCEPRDDGNSVQPPD